MEKSLYTGRFNCFEAAFLILKNTLCLIPELFSCRSKGKHGCLAKSSIIEEGMQTKSKGYILK
jgi:hypothetical protein